jgi:hypothetical protein
VGRGFFTKKRGGVVSSAKAMVFQLYFGMPEYENGRVSGPAITATFKFDSQEDYDKFHALVKEHVYGGKKVFDGMQSLTEKQTWYPLKPKASEYEYSEES